MNYYGNIIRGAQSFTASSNFVYLDGDFGLVKIAALSNDLQIIEYPTSPNLTEGVTVEVFIKDNGNRRNITYGTNVKRTVSYDLPSITTANIMKLTFQYVIWASVGYWFLMDFKEITVP